MTEPDEAMREGLRRLAGPSTEAEARMLASIWARVGGGGEPDEGSSDLEHPDEGGGLHDAGLDAAPVPAGSGQVLWATKIVAATVGLTAGGLLVLKLGAIAVERLSGDTRTMEVIEHAEVREAPTAGPGEASASPPAIDVEPGVELPDDSPGKVEPIVRKATEPSSASDSTDTDLAAELALVRAAESLQERDPVAALATLERHRDEFTAGVLAPERDAMRVKLLCKLGRDGEATQAMAAFLAAHANSPLADAVRQGCSASP
jgi:hypothetical protein